MEKRSKKQLVKLIDDLWNFIEDVSEDDPTRTDQFFALRERVREGWTVVPMKSVCVGRKPITR